MAPAERELLSQDLSYVLHGESLCRHAALLGSEGRRPQEVVAQVIGMRRFV